MELDEKQILELKKSEIGTMKLDDFISGKPKEATIINISKVTDVEEISKLLLKFAKKMYYKGYESGFKEGKEFK